jgi:hypothetical protein
MYLIVDDQHERVGVVGDGEGVIAHPFKIDALAARLERLGVVLLGRQQEAQKVLALVPEVFDEAVGDALAREGALGVVGLRERRVGVED